MLTKCKECKKRVSFTALLCPHCGVANPASMQTLLFIVLTICAVGLLVCFYLRSGTEPTTTVAQPYHSTISPAEPPAPMKAEPLANPSPPPPSQNFAPSLPTTANPYHNELANMSEQQQSHALANILNSNQLACVAQRSYFQGLDTEHTAYWHVECQNGASYMITMRDGQAGKVKAFDCKDLTARNVDCFSRGYTHPKVDILQTY